MTGKSTLCGAAQRVGGWCEPDAEIMVEWTRELCAERDGRLMPPK